MDYPANFIGPLPPGSRQLPLTSAQPPVQTPVRNLQMAANDPATLLAQGQNQSQQVAQNASPEALFGQKLTDMLKTYQQLGTKPFVMQGLNAQDAQLQAGNNALTDPNMRGYTPSTIFSGANAAQAPYNPTIQGAQNNAQTFGEQLKSFGSSVDSAKSYLQQVQTTQNQQRDDARAVVNQILTTTDPTSLHGLNRDELASLEKQAGYPKGFLDSAVTYKQKQEAIAQQNANRLSNPNKITNPTTPTTNSQTITDPVTDAAVATIIQNNPNEWGKSADSIDAQFGKGTATKYDPWLKAVYQDGQNINSVYQPTPFGGLSGINLSRVTASSNRIVSNLVNSGSYKVVSEGAPYLSRIQVASSNPGSVSDTELLDSVTKLNTGGNQVTDAQIKTITGGRSFSDTTNILQNKLKNGGVLSSNQRSQLQQLAQATYKKYLQDYQAIYNQGSAQLKAAGIPPQYWTIPNWNTLVGQQQAASNDSSNDKTNSGLGYKIIQ